MFYFNLLNELKTRNFKVNPYTIIYAAGAAVLASAAGLASEEAGLASEAAELASEAAAAKILHHQ